MLRKIARFSCFFKPSCKFSGADDGLHTPGTDDRVFVGTTAQATDRKRPTTPTTRFTSWQELQRHGSLRAQDRDHVRGQTLRHQPGAGGRPGTLAVAHERESRNDLDHCSVAKLESTR